MMMNGAQVTGELFLVVYSYSLPTDALRTVSVKLPFLVLDKQFVLEAMNVLFNVKHLFLTSREALDLTMREELVCRLRHLTIFERDPKECSFTNVDPDYLDARSKGDN